MRQPPVRILGWVSVIGWVACGGALAPPKPPEPVRLRPAVASAPGTFWQETPVVDVKLAPAKLDRATLVGSALGERFAALEPSAQEALRENGVLVVPRADRERSLGAIYVELARRRAPFVVTLDVLFSLAIRAVECALSETDDEAVGTELAGALERTEARLVAESRAARSDTAPAYALARGVVQVGRELLDPATELAAPASPGVDRELAKVLAHEGPAKSPLFGRLLDYGAFDTQAGLAFGDARAPRFRAAAWVARAPLALASDVGVDIATARMQTRAAMLLARDTNDAWTLLAQRRAFASGPPDDPDPAALGRVAHELGIDLRDEENVGNVVRVDKLRAALLRDAGVTVEDTGGTAATFRLLAPSAPPDVRALATDASSPGRLPSALAVGVALGSSEAAALLAAPDRAAPRPREALEGLFLADSAHRHGSLHATGLDALATYLAPSELDAGAPWASSTAAKRRKLEVALAAWAELRHAEIPFARASARETLDEPEAAFDGVRGAIEPAPEAIARLASLVRQAQRGLAAHGGLRDNGPAWVVLDRVFLLLGDALAIAEAQGLGPLAPPLAHALATMPSRIAILERTLGPAASPEIVVTAADLASGRVVEDATGEADEVWLAVDVAGVASLYVGAGIPFYERVVTLRSNDAAFGRQLGDAPLAHPEWTNAFSAR